MERFRSRIHSKDTFYYQSQEHNDNFIVSFVYTFENETSVKFAYCVPYTYSQLVKWIDDLEKRSLPYFENKILCNSIVRSIKKRK